MTDASDETKRKFREALDQKKSQAQGTDHKDGHSKVDKPTDPSATSASSVARAGNAPSAESASPATGGALSPCGSVSPFTSVRPSLRCADHAVVAAVLR